MKFFKILVMHNVNQNRLSIKYECYEFFKLLNFNCTESKLLIFEFQ